MAISTNGLQLVRIAGAVFNQQLSASDYSEILAANKTAAELDAWANAAVAAEFRSKTTTDIAKAVLANVGLSSVAGLEAWVAAQLTAGGGVAKAGQTMLSLLNDYSNMSTTDATYGASVVTFNTKTAASQLLSQTPGTATGTYAAVASVNTALTLTASVQTSTGTAGDDTFTAAAGTLNVGDVVNGGTGIDTLNATITGTAPTQSATSLVSVEVLNLTATPNPATLDLTGVTGLTQVNNVSSANGATLTVSGVGNPVNTTITGGGSATTITYGTAVTAATALTDAATLTLNGTAAGTTFTGNGVEIMTIASNTAANTLTTFADTGLKSATITGSQALTVGGTFGGTTLTTVTATDATGALTINQLGAGPGTTALPTGVTFTGGSGVTTLTTGAFNDTVTLGNATGNILVTGSGNDTITTGTGTNTVTPGTGNDTVNLFGADTVRFDESGPTNSDIINGFSTGDVIALRLGSAQAAATTTTNAVGATAGTFGIVQTNATTPTLPNVNGVGTGTAIALQNVFPNATASSNTVLGTSNVLNVSGVLTDGTAQGIINVLGTTATGAGITTTPNGKFVIVAYTAGNVAQIWQYLGDGANVTGTAASSVAVDGAIQANELALVATLNGVSPGSLTAAAFSTYLTPGGAVTTVTTGTGQVINLTGLLNTVQNTANAAGQFLTSANDTINVAVGTLPTGSSSTTTGLTIIDSGTSDADVMNATVLGDWAAGTILSGIETVNLNSLVAGTTFSAAARTPGTTTFGLTGSQNFVVSALPASPTISLNSTFQGSAATPYSGAVTGSMNTTGAFNVALNGVGTLTAATSSAASSVTAPSLAMITLNGGGNAVVGGVGTTSTVTVTGTNILQAQAANADATLGSASLFGVPAGTGTGTPEQVITLTGSGALTIVGGGAVFNQAGITTNTGWTGSLTLRPTNNTAFDMTGITTGSGSVVGVNTIDLSSTPAPGTITLAAANGNFPVTLVSTSPTNIGSFTVGYASTSPTTQNNQLVVTESNASANVGALTTPFVNTLTINLGGTAGTTATKTLGNVTMDVNAANQNLTITSNALATTAGVLIADTVTTTGVVGTFTGSFNTATVANGGTGSVFNGNATQASFITGTPGGNDLITTGSANDSITLGTGNSNATGGLGNDTYIFAGTASGNTIVTDAGGTDVFAFTNAAGGETATINSGATLAAMSVERLMVTSGQAITVASAQVGAQNINGIGGATVGLTLATAGGTLNASTLTFTQANGITASNGTLTGVVPTLLVLTGSGNADTITGGGTVTDSIVGGAGNDSLTGGEGADTINGGNGNDTIVLTETTAAADQVWLTGTSAITSGLNNGGMDTVTGFANTAGQDVLRFGSTYLGGLGFASGSISTIAANTANGLSGASTRIVIVSDNLTGASGSGAIATLVSGDSGLSAAGSQAVVIVADDGSNAYVWYVNDSLDGTQTNVSSTDIVLIGTLTGTDVAAFTAANFGAAV